MASTKIYENREHSLQSEQVIPESPVKASSERLEYYRGADYAVHTGDSGNACSRSSSKTHGVKKSSVHNGRRHRAILITLQCDLFASKLKSQLVEKSIYDNCIYQSRNFGRDPIWTASIQKRDSPTERARIENPVLIPEKPKIKYKKAYEAFNNWQRENDVLLINQNVLLGYFQVLSKNHGPSSLCVYYSIWRSMFNINENIGMKEFYRSPAFIKRQNVGKKVKKAKVLSNNNIQKNPEWRSTNIAEGYVEESIENKIKMAKRMFDSASSAVSGTFSSTISALSAEIIYNEDESEVVQQNTFSQMKSSNCKLPGIAISGLKDCAINVYFNRNYKKQL
ncbi:hypothetical protein Zmor_001991 [Zophobas morio]|uniref:Uncharacterized protein n=1 Tax=Zophobas morio TaxID=2755281 RepID=A0AA38IZZ1_9CUCU|nr:hypothetical protein Zmor_001991 [Zophobas morio]